MSLLLSENDPAHDGFAADHQFDVGDVDADASSYHNDEYDGSVHDQASYHGAAVQSFEQDTGDEYQHHQGADAEEQLNDENVCVEEQLDIVNAGVEDQDDFGEELDEAQTGGDGCDGSTMSQLNDGFLYENGTDGDEEQELPADVMENHEDYAALNGNYDDMGEELAAEMVENDGTLAAINESYSGMVDNYAVSGGVMSEGEAGKPGMGEELEEDEEGEDMGEELAAEMVENDGTLAAINESYSGMVDNYAVSGGVISDGEAGKPGLGEELEEDEEGEDMGVDFELMQEDSNLEEGVSEREAAETSDMPLVEGDGAVEGVSEIPIVGVEANVHISGEMGGSPEEGEVYEEEGDLAGEKEEMGLEEGENKEEKEEIAVVDNNLVVEGEVAIVEKEAGPVVGSDYILMTCVLEVGGALYWLSSNTGDSEVGNMSAVYDNVTLAFSGKEPSYFGANSLTSFILELKNSFLLKNDINIQFPQLGLTFPESSVHCRYYNLRQFCEFYEGLRNSGEIPTDTFEPLKIVVIETDNSFETQMKYLVSLLPQGQNAGHGFENNNLPNGIQDGSGVLDTDAQQAITRFDPRMDSPEHTMEESYVRDEPEPIITDEDNQGDQTFQEQYESEVYEEEIPASPSIPVDDELRGEKRKATSLYPEEDEEYAEGTIEGSSADASSPFEKKTRLE